MAYKQTIPKAKEHAYLQPTISKFKILFDNGKPYEETAKDGEELKAKLKKFYEDNKDEGGADAKVFIYDGDKKDYTDYTYDQIQNGEAQGFSFKGKLPWNLLKNDGIHPFAYLLYLPIILAILYCLFQLF